MRTFLFLVFSAEPFEQNAVFGAFAPPSPNCAGSFSLIDEPKAPILYWLHHLRCKFLHRKAKLDCAMGGDTMVVHPTTDKSNTTNPEPSGRKNPTDNQEQPGDNAAAAK